ncbi:MAG: hypothetical protein LBS48_04945 [Treponema sp.]|jgi:ABC-type arginine transport system permease subunit|nr:hypothetical protein [Treponema sp.]
MTVDELRVEVEGIVSNLNSSGFDVVDAETIEKLDKLSVGAGELGMKEGRHLIENLSGAMKAIKDGKSQAGSGMVRLTALDFYLKKLAASNTRIEDL